MARRSQDLAAEDDATMANDNDMNQRLERVETAVNGLEKKIDELPTKADFTTLINKVTTLLEDSRDDVKKAAEGFQATLDRIETDLGELNKKVDVKFGDHDKVLANHNARITVLEASPRPEAERL
jgi:septation ring formation regulator EzrA